MKEIKKNNIKAINSLGEGNINIPDNYPKKITKEAEKRNLNKNNLDELYVEFYNQNKDFGVPEDEREEHTLFNLYSYLINETKTPEEIGKEMDKIVKNAEEARKQENCQKTSNITSYRWDQTPDYHREDIFTWKDCVYYKINDKPMRFIVNNYRENKISTIEIRCKEVAPADYECEIDKSETHGNIAFNNVTEHVPIIKDMPRVYSFNCTDPYNNKLNYTGSFNDISTEIDADGYIYQERKIKEILKKVKDMLQKKGDYELSRLPPSIGFYSINGKIETNMNYSFNFTKEELKKALRLLEDFANFYEENKQKLGYILHWQIIAPFNFAMKMVGNGNLLPSLYLVGRSGSGKTTISSLTMFIWNTIESDTIHTSGSVDTVARFGNAVSNMTFPVVFDEGNIIFDKNHQAIFELFKSSLYQKIVRSIMDTNRKNIKIPALSSIIFTSNFSAPKKAEAGRRIDIFDFTIDHARSKAEINQFEDTFEPKNQTGTMKKLNVIGMFVAKYMMKHPNYIKKPWLEVANELWEKMYEFAEMDIPNWITNYENPKGFEDAWEDENDRLFIIFKELLLKNATTTNEVYESNNKTVRPRTPRDKAEEVIRTGRESWIQLYIPKRGPDKDKELVLIDSGIIEDMNEKYHMNYDLKRIAEDLGGKYDGKHVNGKSSRFAFWELKEFLDMFGEK